MLSGYPDPSTPLAPRDKPPRERRFWGLVFFCCWALFGFGGTFKGGGGGGGWFAALFGVFLKNTQTLCLPFFIIYLLNTPVTH